MIETKDSDLEIVARDTDQPTLLPPELRRAIERRWDGAPVQLYAMADLDPSMRLARIWLALGKEHLAIARQPVAGGEPEIQSYPRSQIRDLTETPGLSCNVLSIMGGPGEPALAVLRYTQRQRKAIENIAFVIERQTGIISAEPVLAALMPVVALLGGNGGIQSLAVVIRSMATGDLPRARIWEVMRRQVSVGLLNGAFLAVAAMALTLGLLSMGLFSSNFGAGKVAVVVGVAAVANLTIATLAGTGIPIALRRMGFDPALAASIFLTLITDVVGFGGFLMVAAALL